METLPLSQLAAFIRRVFALNLPEPVWVSAELAQVSESRGHVWLTLVEKSTEQADIVAQLDAVIWASALKRIRKEHSARLVGGLLQQGMSVRLRVTASFHERFGLKLVVEDIDPAHTLGSLERRRQATLEALSRDGLLDRNAALAVPAVPQRLAVISADTAAGLADFTRQLEGNPYGYVFRTDLYAAAMQGAQTGEEIVTRLRQIVRRKEEYDLLVIVRGGGGKTDLAAFDEEALCRAVAAAPLPVLVGIGHEIDDTVLDRVVHRSLKTPTAVAVYLIEQLLRAESGLLHTGRAIASLSERQLAGHLTRLESLRVTIGQSAATLLQSGHLRTAALETELHRSADRALTDSRGRMDNYGKLLEALRPETTLARGYALVSQHGKLLTSPDAVTTGKIDIRLRGGKISLHHGG